MSEEKIPEMPEEGMDLREDQSQAAMSFSEETHRRGLLSYKL